METSPILATDGRRGATKIMQLSNGQWAHTSGTNILSNSDLLSTFYNKYSIKNVVFNIRVDLVSYTRTCYA